MNTKIKPNSLVIISNKFTNKVVGILFITNVYKLFDMTEVLDGIQFKHKLGSAFFGLYTSSLIPKTKQDNKFVINTIRL